MFLHSAKMTKAMEARWRTLAAGLCLLVLFSQTAKTEEQAGSGKESFSHVIHVASGGKDSNPGTEAEPLASLEAARDKVRSLLPTMQGDILVAVAPGDYILDRPFVLRPEDSGQNGFRVYYRGLGKPGSARLLGSRKVTGWQSEDGRLYHADVGKEADFHTLYEDGIRARKARYPNHEFHERFPLSGARYLNAEKGTKTELTWREGDLNQDLLKNLDAGANLVYWPHGYAAWNKTTHPIEKIDFKVRTISVPNNQKGPAIGQHARYYLEGDRRFLDQPGEFYLDRVAGKLYYWPRLGDPNQNEILVPHLKRVISLEGTSEQPVANVVIEGLGISGTDTFATQTNHRGFPWTPETGGYGVHGLAHLRFTKNVELRNNHLSQSGLNGIYLERSNADNLIYGNWIENVGISGICFAYHREREKFPEEKNTRIRVENTLIHNLGGIAVDSAGINIWGAADNTVIHCEIFDGARYGVSLRGNYTQIRHGEGGKPADTDRPYTENNVVSHSRFHRLGQDSGDTGAIHMAGISSLDHFPVNRLEQILITDIEPHPSMNDLQPNGIFFDYPRGVTDQVLRNVEIRKTEIPFRVNKTDIRHTYDNVSWKEGFDSSKMEYDQIGLKPDFPASFRAPGEVTQPVVTSAVDGQLTVSWTDPDDSDLARVWVGIEGLPQEGAVEVKAGEEKTTLSAPPADRIFFYRIRSVDQWGNRSPGVLVRAGVDPGQVTKLVAEGVDGGIGLEWKGVTGAEGYRVSVDDSQIAPVEVKGGRNSVTLKGLENSRTYTITVQAIDEKGLAWPGTSLKTFAGEGAAIPLDATAWWSFDEPEIREGLSIGDQSGNGNTLFVGTETVGLTDGKFGKAMHFDGERAFIRALAPQPLAIGTGDYAISVWIRQDSTGNFTQRFLDFGGANDRPGICLMANNTDVRVLFSDGKNRYSPFYRGLDLPGKWTHVVVNLDREGDLDLYVDGEKLISEDISKSSGKDIAAADDFFLGRYFQSKADFNWPGSLDQLRIFQRKLTPAEISALYHRDR